MAAKMSRRDGLLAALFGAGHVGLRALATGLRLGICSIRARPPRRIFSVSSRTPTCSTHLETSSM